MRYGSDSSAQKVRAREERRNGGGGRGGAVNNLKRNQKGHAADGCARGLQMRTASRMLGTNLENRKTEGGRREGGVARTREKKQALRKEGKIHYPLREKVPSSAGALLRGKPVEEILKKGYTSRLRVRSITWGKANISVKRRNWRIAEVSESLDEKERSSDDDRKSVGEVGDNTNPEGR